MPFNVIQCHQIRQKKRDREASFLFLLQKLLRNDESNGLWYDRDCYWSASLQLAIRFEWNGWCGGYLYTFALRVLYVPDRVYLAIEESCCTEYNVPPVYGADNRQIE